MALRVGPRGKAVGSVVTRRKRQHPHDFGRASTFVETVDLPALEALSERVLKAIGYYGLVEVEFKLDPRDGQFKLLDSMRALGVITRLGRTPASIFLACCMSISFPVS